jgi:endonuclease/exonuclease/phosphatase (EEP) superfamily protein YafD
LAEVQSVLVDDLVEASPMVRSRRRLWFGRLAVLAALFFAAWAVMRVGGFEQGALFVPLVSLTPYATAVALAALVLVALTRHKIAIAIMLAACVSLLWCVLPRAVADSPAAEGRPLRVLTANLNGGHADPAVIVDLVRRLDVEVLSLQELTWREQDRLDLAGLATLLPYRVLQPGNGPEGSGVYARHPLTERTGLFQPVGHHMPVAEVALPGGSAVEVVVVHPVAPVPSTVPEWEMGVATLPGAPASGPPRILAGDFNATMDHAVFRRLLATGYSDAASATGDGLIPTWPMDGRLPPFVTIDHVLTDGRSWATAVQIYDIPGSDHRALFADLRVRP